MLAESIPVENAPHPLAVAQAALMAERWPVVLWRAPGDRTYVASGRALSRDCSPESWRENFPVHCEALLAEASASGAGENARLFFSLFFDPEQDAGEE